MANPDAFPGFVLFVLSPDPDYPAPVVSDFLFRFGGVSRLYGAAALECLRRTHILVIGLGGVGSWSVESLARCGVGGLTLVDLDEICVSNVNRQLPALDGTVGRAKAEVLAERVRAINPECRVTPILDFFTESNANRLLTPPAGGAPYSGVLDAIDDVANKCRLIAGCRERGIPVMSCGGAGGRRDATRVRVEDLSRVTHDRLLGSVRKRLRQEYGFSRAGAPLGVDCVFSPEPPVFPQADGSVCVSAESAAPGESRRLNCDRGLGSSVFVTGTFGFIAAGHLVQRLLSTAGAVGFAVSPAAEPGHSGGDSP